MEISQHCKHCPGQSKDDEHLQSICRHTFYVLGGCFFFVSDVTQDADMFLNLVGREGCAYASCQSAQHKGRMVSMQE